MKNNPNSLINKFADIHTELVKLNKRQSNIEIYLDRTNLNLKDEIFLRDGIEKKNFLNYESLNEKISMLKSSIHEKANEDKVEISEMKNKFEEMIKSCQVNNKKDSDEKTIRLDIIEGRVVDNEKTIENIKNLIESKNAFLLESFNKEIREVKSDIEKQTYQIQSIDKKNNEVIGMIINDIKEINKNIIGMKNDIEVIKVFKENTNINFKDITNEFVKK